MIVLLLAPALLVLGVFSASYAIFAYHSFLRVVPGTTEVTGPVTLHNYIRFLSDPFHWTTLGDTLWLGAQLTVIVALLGYSVAFVAVRTRSDLVKRAILYSTILSFFSGIIVRVYAWLTILGNNGVINVALKRLQLEKLHLVHNELGVMISLTHFLLPFFILTMIGVLKGIPEMLEESAVNLGASRLRTFIHVTLPLSVPGLLGSMSLIYSVALSAFLFPMLLGGGKVRTAANVIYDYIFVQFDIPFAAVTSMFFLAAAMLVIALLSIRPKHAREVS